MIIPVKELLQLEKNNSKTHLNLFYAAQQLPQGRMLTSIGLGKKDITINDAKVKLDLHRLAFYC